MATLDAFHAGPGVWYGIAQRAFARHQRPPSYAEYCMSVLGSSSVTRCSMAPQFAACPHARCIPHNDSDRPGGYTTLCARAPALSCVGCTLGAGVDALRLHHACAHSGELPGCKLTSYTSLGEVPGLGRGCF